MFKLIKSLFQDKKDYNEQMKRVEALPEEYRFVFKKIQGYMWQFAGGSGKEMLQTQKELLELFEMSAADGIHVLDVTGEDVALFVDELIRDTKKWTDFYRNRLNRKFKDTIEK